MYHFSESGSASVSVNQWYGSEDPHSDPYQNVTDPQHCVRIYRYSKYLPWVLYS
jgi:hypothetical protein